MNRASETCGTPLNVPAYIFPERKERKKDRKKFEEIKSDHWIPKRIDIRRATARSIIFKLLKTKKKEKNVENKRKITYHLQGNQNKINGQHLTRNIIGQTAVG